MATKKRGGSSTATKRKSTAKRKISVQRKTTGTTEATGTAFRGKALAGRATKGEEFDLNDSGPQAMAAAAATEVREPRPYKSRYPIPDEEFKALKQTSLKVKLATGDAFVAKDSGKKEEVAVAFLGSAGGVEAPPSAAPTPSSGFPGIAATGWLPADCTVATGPNHVLASVNSSVAIYNKTGGAALLQRTLTAWFSNVIQGATIFDPKALYDQHNNRWVLLAVAVAQNPNRSAFLLSISATANPMGPWRNYTLNATLDGNTPTNNWADFPGLGVDNQAIYITANMFRFNGNFQYSKIRVIPKAGPYSGGPAPYFDFVRMQNLDRSLAFTIQPCHTFGAPQTEYLVNSYFPSGNRLTLWSIRNSGTVPVLTRATVNTGAYALPPNAEQRGGNQPLNTGDIRILHAVFRGGSVWTALTTSRNWGTGANKAAIHWFQINAAPGTLIQQGIYGATGLHYFYPAACPDNNGNVTFVFSRCGTNEFASVYFTGRRSTDPLGSLQASALLRAGVANYVGMDGGGRNRWGDYCGIAADPVNGRMIWVYNKYAAGVNTWGTWVGSCFF